MRSRTRKMLGGAALLVACSLAPQVGLAGGPDAVQLDRLANLFEPVAFDHAMHADLAGDCAQCHHHTLGGAPADEKCGRCHEANQPAASVACGDCHAADRFQAGYLGKIEADPTIYHTGKPGLKGAYHQKCLGCHQSMGGPTGCEDCHGLSDKGKEFYKTGRFTPAAPVHEKGGH